VSRARSTCIPETAPASNARCWRARSFLGGDEIDPRVLDRRLQRAAALPRVDLGAQRVGPHRVGRRALLRDAAVSSGLEIVASTCPWRTLSPACTCSAAVPACGA
jgi:hypothetical protein